MAAWIRVMAFLGAPLHNIGSFLCVPGICSPIFEEFCFYVHERYLYFCFLIKHLSTFGIRVMLAS